VEELGQTPYRVNMTLASDRFQLEPFLSPGAKGGDQSATEQPGTPAAKPAEEAGPISLPVQATGQIRIAKALYHDLTIDTFDLEFTLDKNILTVSRMTGATGGGTFSNTARVDLGQKGFAYATTIGVKGVKAAEILPPFFPKTKGSVSGTMDLTADLTGAGTRPATAKRALQGKGELLLVDGELTGTGMAEGLASFLGLQELRVLRFSRFLTRFAIAAGVARIDSEASGSDIRLSPTGTVGLMDEAVDLSLNAKLSPALSAKLDRQGQFSKLLGAEEGWTPLPLKVTGTVGTPRFTLDSTQLMKKATGELQKRMLDQLRPKQEVPATDGQPPAQQSPAQGMENTIRGLFGR
jgi:AsmA protein